MPIFDAAELEIFLYAGRHSSRALDECAKHRATRKRLDADAAVSSAKVEEAAGPDAPREQPKHGLANLSRRCRRVYRFDVSKQLAAMSAVSDLKVGCYPGTLDVLPGLPSRRPAPWPGRRHLALARRRTVF